MAPGRHRPESVDPSAATFELPRIEPTTVTVDTRGRHRPEILGLRAERATRWEKREADRKGWLHRMPRSHRKTSHAQAAVMAGIGAFTVTVVALGGRETAVDAQAPVQRPEGTFLHVMPGSVMGASGGTAGPVASEPRPSVRPSPSRIPRSADSRSGRPVPAETTRASTPSPATSSPGAGDGPSPEADPPDTSTPDPEPDPQPIPAPTTVTKTWHCPWSD